jgi:hypothetical protein
MKRYPISREQLDYFYRLMEMGFKQNVGAHSQLDENGHPCYCAEGILALALGHYPIIWDQGTRIGIRTGRGIYYNNDLSQDSFWGASNIAMLVTRDPGVMLARQGDLSDTLYDMNDNKRMSLEEIAAHVKANEDKYFYVEG